MLTMSEGDRLTAAASALGLDASVVRLLDPLSAASSTGTLPCEETVTLDPVSVS